MITVHSTEEARPFLASGCCLTIGNFDGMHMGHRRLLARTRERAEERGLLCAVLCFHPHPVHVLAPGHVPSLLTGRAQRLRLLAGQGADLCLELPFTPEFSALSPEDFVIGTLVPLGVRELIIGYDFSLGRKRSGNAETLAALGNAYGFDVEQIAPVIVQDAVVSSTRVRDLILAGRVWEARVLLGRFHSICGPVIRGEGRGRSLGFPTANLALPDNVLPKDGVYATMVRIEDVRRPAVTNIGVKPTFGVSARGVETFIPDVEQDLYGKELEIFFVQHLRDEERFTDAEALRLRIERDMELARSVPDLHIL